MAIPCKDRLISLFHVSDEFKLLWKERNDIDDERIRNSWNTRFSGKEAGNKVSFRKSSGTSYISVCVDGDQHGAHRIIWVILNGEIPDGFEIDHVNGDGTDNRISNLRLVSRAENMKNLAIRVDNKTGVTGVCFFRAKYLAQIMHCGKNINLGSYSNVEDAAKARKAAEIEYGFHHNHGRSKIGI